MVANHQGSEHQGGLMPLLPEDALPRRAHRRASDHPNLRTSRRKVVAADSGHNRTSAVQQTTRASRSLGTIAAIGFPNDRSEDQGMRRREFIAGLGSAVVWPLATRAQQSVPTVGFLSGSVPYTDRFRWFLEGLRETGFIEGQNVAIESRWADGRYDQLPTLAEDLVRHKVQVIAATGGLSEALAAKAATSSIPIVFQTGVDPVAAGLVASLARPGGNVTGVTQLSVELLPKLLEALRDMFPAATRVAFLVNPVNVSRGTLTQEVQAAGRVLGIEILVVHASNDESLDHAFEASSKQGASALIIGADAFMSSRSEQLATLALHHGMPAIYAFRGFPLAGGLMSYGGSLADAQRTVGVCTGRILKGEKPADLPVQQVTKIELVINLKTAKALGLTIPETRWPPPTR
jgi:putative tryptophan/tyrosine transport system substrate-binding protein